MLYASSILASEIKTTFHKKGRKMRRDPKAQKKASLESCRELSEPHHEMSHLRDENIKISAALQKMVDDSTLFK